MGDATISATEGLNGTSLSLDGQGDYAKIENTNSTRKITSMTISAWVKPDYSDGSPEFTVISKTNTFILSINNKIPPQGIAKFSIFDGIKWTTVESNSTIAEEWTHLAAKFNTTAIQIYVNGNLESIAPVSGVPYITVDGQIDLKTVDEITSEPDIVIGAYIGGRMKSSAHNLFSGLIDGALFFDSDLEVLEVASIYSQDVPTNATDSIIQNETSSAQDGVPPEPILKMDLNSTTIEGQSLLENYNGTDYVSVNEKELNEDLNQLTIAAWVKPLYTIGNPEFTVVSKEKAFELVINNKVNPKKIAKFSIFDGIKWQTVESKTQIEEEWTHLDRKSVV